MGVIGYGSDRDQADKPPCSDQPISKGESVAVVTAKCGKPTGTERREEFIQELKTRPPLRTADHTPVEN